MRKLKIHQAEAVIARVKLLVDLRIKHGYKKISDKRRKRLRVQMRYQIQCLKTALPRMEDVFSPCDPDGWEIIDTSEREKANAATFYAMMAAMGMP